MGFGTVYDQESNAPLRYFVDCDVGEEESYSGKNVIVLMNQGKCTPYEQFIALQDAGIYIFNHHHHHQKKNWVIFGSYSLSFPPGASAVIFVPDYTGPFQEFEGFVYSFIFFSKPNQNKSKQSKQQQNNKTTK